VADSDRAQSYASSLSGQEFRAINEIPYWYAFTGESARAAMNRLQNENNAILFWGSEDQKRDVVYGEKWRR